MRIGELSRITEVSARSLRYYESLGLIRSTRTPNGWRDFDGAAFDRVVHIPAQIVKEPTALAVHRAPIPIPKSCAIVITIAHDHFGNLQKASKCSK